MRVAIVSYMGFDGPGVMHAHHFANQLAGRGHEVLMLLHGDPATARLMVDPPAYEVVPVSFRRGALARRTRRAVERFDPEIVHLWTPRHLPVRTGGEAWMASDARLVVHYEDDERFILDHFAGHRFCDDDLALYDLLRSGRRDPDRVAELAAGIDRDFVRLTLEEPESWNWLHPLLSPVVERLADGATAISEEYARHLRADGDRPVHLLYPGVDRRRFHPREKPGDLVRELELEGRTVLLYSGAIADIHDFPDLLEALPAVVERHPEVVLAQIGANRIPEVTARLVEAGGLEDHVRFVGQVPHRRMADHLALGDLFLGHLRHDRFNAHRLPSKLPEYMAMGRPIAVADHGFGRVLTDSGHAFAIADGGPAEIADAVRRALGERQRWPEMGRGLERLAAELFDWGRNSEALASFYRRLVADPRRVPREGEGDPIPLQELRPRRGRRSGGERASVLVITDGRIGERMSGTGIRYFEIARALARRFDVAVGHPYPDRPDGFPFELLHWAPDRTREVMARARRADAVIVHGFVLEKLPELARCGAWLVVDLYCPFVFENLEIHRDRGLDLDEREAIHGNDLRVLTDQVRLADHLLVSTPGQRDWALGLATALNRLRPSTLRRWSRPSDLVSLVPFGLDPDTAADGERPVLKGVWPGVGADDLVLLWGGGLWSWLDPLTPIRAMGRVAEVRDDVKLVFLSTRTAENVVGMPVGEACTRLADQLGLAGRSVIFNRDDYVPYDQRAAYFAEADVGVSAHLGSFETHFAFRTRVLDYLAAGLPILASEGDYFGEVVRRHEIGRVLPIGDDEAWATAILELAGDRELRREMSARVLERRRSFAWERAVAPLVRWIESVAAEEPPRAPRGADGDGGEAVADDAGDAFRILAASDLPASARRRLVELEAGWQRLERRIDDLERERRQIRRLASLARRVPLARRAWRALRRLG